MSRRLTRINEQLKRELSTLIATRLRDPRIGLVTVVAVDVAADLGSAKIYTRPLLNSGTETSAETAAEVLRVLEAAAPVLRRELGEILHYRRVPELRFRLDRSLEHSRRIEQLLAELGGGVDQNDM